MKRPRASIFSLMAVVGIVALNLAFARTVFPGEPWRLAGIGMIGSLIQVGLFFLIRARGKRRHYAFWAGFEAGSLLGAWSFLYARVPGSWVGYPWDNYAEFIDGWLLRAFDISVLNRGALDPVLLWTVTVFAFLPQLLMGLAGGLLGLSFAWSARSRNLMFALFAVLLLNLAAWLAAWTALPAQPPWLPFGITPGGVLLELGLFGLIRGWGRHRTRAFWMVFSAVDSLVLWSYLQAMVFTRIQTARYFTYWPSGPSYARSIPRAPLWDMWIDYTAVASFVLGRPPYGTYIVVWTNFLTDSLVYILIVLVPHLLAAIGGGTLAVFVMRIASIRAQAGRGPGSLRKLSE